MAQHTYETPGRPACAGVRDRPRRPAGLPTGAVIVEPLVSLGSAASSTTCRSPEGEVTRRTRSRTAPTSPSRSPAVNGMPSVGDGLPAADVVLELQLPQNLGVRDIATDRAVHARRRARLTCALGELAAGRRREAHDDGDGTRQPRLQRGAGFRRHAPHQLRRACSQKVSLYASVQTRRRHGGLGRRRHDGHLRGDLRAQSGRRRRRGRRRPRRPQQPRRVQGRLLAAPWPTPTATGRRRRRACRRVRSDCWTTCHRW